MVEGDARREGGNYGDAPKDEETDEDVSGGVGAARNLTQQRLRLRGLRPHPFLFGRGARRRRACAFCVCKERALANYARFFHFSLSSQGRTLVGRAAGIGTCLFLAHFFHKQVGGDFHAYTVVKHYPLYELVVLS